MCVMQKQLQVKLGCGLLALGRIWGFQQRRIPNEDQAQQFLDSALSQGITFYDTAPSYGDSEEKLGRWLKSLTSAQRGQLTIATKFGEHWNKGNNHPYTDFGFSALKKSLNKSMKNLGKIDVLQLHKASLEVLSSKDFWKSLEYARSLGINNFGISTSDIEVAGISLVFDDLDFVQIPYNRKNKEMQSFFGPAENEDKTLIINRPLNMGAMIANAYESEKERDMVNAYRFILKQKFQGYILTGTTSETHLAENISAFNRALDLER